MFPTMLQATIANLPQRPGQAVATAIHRTTVTVGHPEAVVQFQTQAATIGAHQATATSGEHQEATVQVQAAIAVEQAEVVEGVYPQAVRADQAVAEEDADP